MSDPARVQAALERHSWTGNPFGGSDSHCRCGVRYPECDAAILAAEVERLSAEVDRLHTWQGIMALVDEHYPEDIFPTLPDDPSRDPGPRIVSLLRTVDELRTTDTPASAPAEAEAITDRRPDERL